jgi:outer membrane lipoprotein SlyB
MKHRLPVGVVALLGCIALVFGGTGCSSLDPNSYDSVRAGAARRAYAGKIVETRTVRIRPEGGSVGGLIGSVLGGVGGSFIGGGNLAPALGTIGGAIGGGLAGDAVEANVRSGKLMTEYLVRTDGGDILSVVQDPKSLPLSIGQRVYVITGGYDERARVIPAPGDY